MTEAGLNVSFGNDDIMDPFYPMGVGDLLDVLSMGIHVCHLTGYKQILSSLNYITTNGARTLNIMDRYGLEEGKPGNLVLIECDDVYDLIRRKVKPTYSVRNGQVIAKNTQPTFKVIQKGDEKEIHFKIK